MFGQAYYLQIYSDPYTFESGETYSLGVRGTFLFGSIGNNASVAQSFTSSTSSVSTNTQSNTAAKLIAPKEIKGNTVLKRRCRESCKEFQTMLIRILEQGGYTVKSDGKAAKGNGLVNVMEISKGSTICSRQTIEGKFAGIEVKRRKEEVDKVIMNIMIDEANKIPGVKVNYYETVKDKYGVTRKVVDSIDTNNTIF